MSEPREPVGGQRRRRRAGSGQRRAAAGAADAPAGPPAPSSAPSPVPGPSQGSPPAKQQARRSRSGSGKRDPGERSLHDLIGAGPSQLGVSGALRGRDVNRPTEQDLAETEREIVIVRRHWRPPPQPTK